MNPKNEQTRQPKPWLSAVLTLLLIAALALFFTTASGCFKDDHYDPVNPNSPSQPETTASTEETTESSQPSEETEPTDPSSASTETDNYSADAAGAAGQPSGSPRTPPPSSGNNGTAQTKPDLTLKTLKAIFPKSQKTVNALKAHNMTVTGETQVTLIAKANSSDAVVKGAGKKSLTIGKKHKFTIKVFSKDGDHSRSYNLTITVKKGPTKPTEPEKSGEASLVSVQLLFGDTDITRALTPGFQPDITQYTVTAEGGDLSNITFNAAPCKGATIIDRSLSPDKKSYTITVQSEDKKNQRVYTFTAWQPAPPEG